jgi:hypothetical protein
VGQAVCRPRPEPCREVIDGLPLYDVVYFKLTTHVAAEALAWCVRPSWEARIQPWSPGWTVFVELRPIESDLASLLRKVAHWAADRKFASVAFELDGREYALLPAPVEATLTA